MRLRLLLAVVIGGALLLTPTAAGAKGADEVKITGAGLDEPIRIKPWTEKGSGAEQIDALVMATRLYSAFGSRPVEFWIPDPPPGDHGPRYVATYSLPGRDNATIRQRLYPFAEGGPLVYMPPGQVMFGVDATGSGWLRVDASLASLLVSFGVPAPRGAQLE